MDRRDFLKASAVAAAIVGLNEADAFADTLSEAEAAAKNKVGKAAKKLALKVPACETATASGNDLSVLFLGTGSAGWKPEKKGHRRMSSVLLDSKVLIDFTLSAWEYLPKDCSPEYIFYTHSHGDHFQPEQALKAGVKNVWVSRTWEERAVEAFSKASAATGLPMPKMNFLEIGQCVEVEGLRITALPANHATSDVKEQCLMYLVEKGSDGDGVRLLYATDTGGIPVRAARIVGLDSHINPGKAITAFVMEATMGLEHDEDFRLFTHSSAATVARTAHMLVQTQRYLPPQGQPVYLTHISNNLHDKLSQDELNASLPEPLRAAYDGLKVVFKAKSL